MGIIPSLRHLRNVRFRAFMPAIIGLAIVSTFYIPAYQQVYSQSQPVALVIGSDPDVISLLEDENYALTESSSLPSDLGEFNVVVIKGNHDLGSSLDGLRSYVEGGGGLVYLSFATETLDLPSNHDWIGAQSYGITAPGENATVSVEDPLGSGLPLGAELSKHSSTEPGSLSVGDLESGAQVLAAYTAGGVFAYSYEYGEGRVYFQADTDEGIGEDVEEANVSQLLIYGIIWASSELEPVEDFLPVGTGITTGNSEPFGSVDAIFSESGFQSVDLQVPSDPVNSIYVDSEGGLVDPILYFVVDGVEYNFLVQEDAGSLLTFSSNFTISSARVEVADSFGGSATAGYVTARNAPSCSLPFGAVASTPASIPSNAVHVGSSGGLPGTDIDISGMPVPVQSVLAGFDGDSNGYVLTFVAGRTSYQCPVENDVIQISFPQPLVLSEISLENDGLWGLVGYLESPASADAYALLQPISGTTEGLIVQPGSEVPEQTFVASFSSEVISFAGLPEPSSEVSAIWISATAELEAPHVYFRSDEDWYSVALDGMSGGALVDLPGSIGIDELYASAEGQSGSITVGYVYPIQLNAKAGVNQSVQEKQLVYLDGRSSTGPAGELSFEWTQIEGPTVTLYDDDTVTAYFSSPEVDEDGERLSFRLAVYDSEGNASYDILTVSVRNVKGPNNSAPQIGTISGASVDEGDRVVLAASAFDPDGDALKYSWSQISGPTARLTGANTTTVSFIAPQVSEDSNLVFQLRVGDGLGHAVTKDVLVTVSDIGTELVPPPVISSGPDQSVKEGDPVRLGGTIVSGDMTGRELRWEQTAGIPVTIQLSSSLNASFIAPQISDQASKLTFRLGVFETGGSMISADEISITVTNASAAPANEVEIKEGDENDPILFEVGEAGFAAVKRPDAEPPTEIHLLQIAPAEGAISPDPVGPVVGIWINTTADTPALFLHFSTEAASYKVDATSDRPMAYVFDRPVELHDIRLSSESAVDEIGIGFYYGQVPLTLSTPEPPVGQDESPPILANPPAEGAVIKFARENQIVAGLMAVGVPAGIGVGLKMVSTRRRRISFNPARALFPKSDPIAGEAEKVKPVIEELEKMLGRNLDTALSASELLDRFGSGRSETAQR